MVASFNQCAIGIPILLFFSFHGLRLLLHTTLKIGALAAEAIVMTTSD